MTGQRSLCYWKVSPVQSHCGKEVAEQHIKSLLETSAAAYIPGQKEKISPFPVLLIIILHLLKQGFSLIQTLVYRSEMRKQPGLN